MKTKEKGVMIMKDGKAWGIVYSDGHCTAYGWIDPERAPIHNSKYCLKPSDATWAGSPHVAEISKGKLVHVERTTTIKILITPEN